MLNLSDKKVLIIKKEHDDFEKIWSDHMRCDMVDVAEPYTNVGKPLHYVRAICKRSKNHFLHGIWLGEWKKRLEKYNYIIVFDNCATEELLKWINEVVPKNNIILWLWNIPQQPIDKLEQYAMISCFDEKYCIKHGYKFVHQFYFEEFLSKGFSLKKDFLYIGTDKGRYKWLTHLAEFARKKELHYYFYLYDKSINGSEIDDLEIIKSNKKVRYSEVLAQISQTKTIIELNIGQQAGLTLRALEALFFDKKLITNNKNIKDFDFYNENNIYIINDNLDRLDEFLALPFNAVPNEIKHRYSYTDWLDKILR